MAGRHAIFKWLPIPTGKSSKRWRLKPQKPLGAKFLWLPVRNFYNNVFNTFYGSGRAWPCRSIRPRNRRNSATAGRVRLSIMASHRIASSSMQQLRHLPFVLQEACQQLTKKLQARPATSEWAKRAHCAANRKADPQRHAWAAPFGGRRLAQSCEAKRMRSQYRDGYRCSRIGTGLVASAWGRSGIDELARAFVLIVADGEETRN